MCTGLRRTCLFKGLPKVMPRDRFKQSMWYLHIADKKKAPAMGSPDYNKLWKVGELLSMVCPKLETVSKCDRNNAIDEAIIPFKGRLGFKQCIRNKPHE